MHLLLTNDDGIDAPGLAVLARVAALLGQAATIAPASHLSGCSHRVTTDQPIRTFQVQPRRWSLEGTPADCVRVGLAHLAPEATWVLSGINLGGNLGADVYHSGTVAAVREAAIHGRPGIALSHYVRRGLALDWDRAARWAEHILLDLLHRPCAPGTFWNINFPHLETDAAEPRVVFCPLDPAPLPLTFRQEGEHFHYAGDYHTRQRRPGSDVDVCFSGHIAVTQMSVA